MWSSQTIHSSLSGFAFPKLIIRIFLHVYWTSHFLLVRCLFMLISCFLFFLLLFNPHLKIHLLILKQGGEHRCERETLISCLSFTPHLGIEPVTYYKQLSHLARAIPHFLIWWFVSLLTVVVSYIFRKQIAFPYTRVINVLSYGRFYFFSFMGKSW